MINITNLPAVFVFDIETAKNVKADIFAMMEEIRNKVDKKRGFGGSLVDPVKIEEKVTETMDKVALDVFNNQIISFSYSTFRIEADGKIEIDTNVIFSPDEESLVKSLFDVLQDFYLKHKQIIFAGFGISYFDIPQIRAKIIKYQPKKNPAIMQNILPVKKYDMYDMSEILGEGKLEKWLKFFGLEGKHEGIDGSEIPKLFEAGQYEKIKVYSAVDARREAELLLKMIGY